MHLHLLLLILPLLFFGVLGSEDEVQALLEFKKGIFDDPLGRVLNSWDGSSVALNGCPQSWYGIDCDDGSGSVTALVLDELNLSGDLKFSTLIGLKMLKNLSLSGNFFTGRLVPGMGGLSSLQYLDLSRNQFSGPIPGRINDLWGLTYLNLSSNNFSGGHPTGIRNLRQLKFLDLHSNQLWGDIGDLLSELRNVEYVDLSFNEFYGGLSLAAENISSLSNTIRYVNMSHNRLSGEFFSNVSLNLLRNLVVLDLGDNQLTGQLPKINSLPNLNILRLGNNRLYGSIQEELLGDSIPLEELDLSNNWFSGSIQGIKSPNLKVLNLSSNLLAGSLPSNLGGCVILDLSKNMISGDISTVQSWGDTMEVIDLSSNSLSGSFPNLTTQFQNLTSIKIRNNSLVGDLPSALGSCPRLSAVDFSLNGLTGCIPTSFFTLLSLTYLNLSGNHFTGSIPLQGPHATESLSSPSYSHIESLDLSSNSLTGSLPSAIGNMGGLKLLNLAKNSLSGQLPSELNKLNGLEYLDLSSNHFSGWIPDRLPSTLKFFNVSYNDLSGTVPGNLWHFPPNSFHPGNPSLISPTDTATQSNGSGGFHGGGQRHNSKTSIRLAIALASVGAVVMIAFVLLAYYRGHLQEFPGRSGISGQTMGRDIKLGRFARPSRLKFQKSIDPAPTSLSFSSDHLLTSNARSMSGFIIGTAERGLTEEIEAGPESIKPDIPDNHPPTSGWNSSPGSTLPSSPRFIEACEQPAMLNVYSPDRLVGELFFLDSSLGFTAEELSRAPAEVLGRSSHGTLYKATLDNGHILTVKWLRIGLVKHKKEFAKEAKKIGSIRHPNIVPLRAYYWGPREQERLIVADYVRGDSMALHLYETTPQRYSPSSFSQRLKIAIDVARCLTYLHDNGLPHGNLKPTNILLTGRDLTARITDYGLHRLMTPPGTAEQILNLGALGYRAPELSTAAKPLPTFKADVYSFGVILMELLTRRSAGDIISGQTGAVDLTDWVRLCAHEGRGMHCFDRDIASGEEPIKAMDDLLAISLRCVLPVNERPNMRQVFEDLCSISV
ncbi:probable inactive receptor kinase At5g10020 [Macadamia integrifolia]|uniref:probable inactive receptor kinase At5g10020 n=1 Tax=Macadamia integrifolia TaxID=60698 RepID=UPI001C4E4942|nr:probable inactive receptor kinase At5g10020 [Macadamia integrifolia]